MTGHTELLHEQAVLYAVFLYFLTANDDFFVSEYFSFPFTVKIACEVVLNIEYCIFLPKIENLESYSTDKDNHRITEWQRLEGTFGDL